MVHRKEEMLCCYLLIIAVSSVWSENTDHCVVGTAWNASASECQCMNLYHIIECHNNRTALNYKVCVTYSRENQVTSVGPCPYNSNKIRLYRKLLYKITETNDNLTSFMCDPLNRTGVLCSRCKRGMGPALLNYSYPCLNCTHYAWPMYFAATLLPTTLLLLVVVVFHIDVTAPSLSYIILHSHLLLMSVLKMPNFLHSATKFEGFRRNLFSCVGTIVTAWNLDFFRLHLPSFCASGEMSMLSVLALEYVVAVYPLLFTAIVYTVIELHARGCKLLNRLWRPLHPAFYRFRKWCDIKGSVINAFATFICLSYAKILITSCNILSYTRVYRSFPNNFSHKTFLYYNSSIHYSDTGNIPYFILAVIMPTLFCILPLAALLVLHTPSCRCLRKFKLLWEVTKIFQRHFKDGTNGNKDYRSFSGLYFMFHVIYLPLYFNAENTFDIRWFLPFLAALLISFLHPYEKKKDNFLATLWFAQLTVLNLSMWYETPFGNRYIKITFFSIGVFLPYIFLSCLLLICAVKATKILSSCKWFPIRELSRLSYHSTDTKEDSLPDRMLNSAEYKPLLQKH